MDVKCPRRNTQNKNTNNKIQNPNGYILEKDFVSI